MNKTNARNKSIITIAVLTVALILLVFTASATSYAASRGIHKPSGDIGASIKGSFIGDKEVIYEHGYSIPKSSTTPFYLSNAKGSEIVKGHIALTISVSINLTLVPFIQSVAIQKHDFASGEWQGLKTVVNKDGIYSSYEKKAFWNNRETINYYRVVIKLKDEVVMNDYTELFKISYSYTN